MLGRDAVEIKMSLKLKTVVVPIRASKEKEVSRNFRFGVN